MLLDHPRPLPKGDLRVRPQRHRSPIRGSRNHQVRRCRDGLRDVTVLPFLDAKINGHGLIPAGNRIGTCPPGAVKTRTYHYCTGFWWVVLSGYAQSYPIPVETGEHDLGDDTKHQSDPFPRGPAFTVSNWIGALSDAGETRWLLDRLRQNAKETYAAVNRAALFMIAALIGWLLVHNADILRLPILGAEVEDPRIAGVLLLVLASAFYYRMIVLAPHGSDISRLINAIYRERYPALLTHNVPLLSEPGPMFGVVFSTLMSRRAALGKAWPPLQFIFDTLSGFIIVPVLFVLPVCAIGYFFVISYREFTTDYIWINVGACASALILLHGILLTVVASRANDP